MYGHAHAAGDEEDVKLLSLGGVEVSRGESMLHPPGRADRLASRPTADVPAQKTAGGINGARAMGHCGSTRSAHRGTAPATRSGHRPRPIIMRGRALTSISPPSACACAKLSTHVRMLAMLQSATASMSCAVRFLHWLARSAESVASYASDDAGYSVSAHCFRHYRPRHLLPTRRRRIHTSSAAIERTEE